MGELGIGAVELVAQDSDLVQRLGGLQHLVVEGVREIELLLEIEA